VIVDTSALLAVLLEEPEADVFTDKILQSEGCMISAVSFVEASVIAETNGGDGGVRQLDSYLRVARISIAPVTEEIAFVARQAYSDFGKGRHPAGFNLGDCFSYALAKVAREPLLFKGTDFRKMDIVPAIS
jgi:ribonuclease VapC